MGCDIHFAVEHKRKFDWEVVPHITYDERNYEAFGILAGVRGDGFPPISPPKGEPHDLSEELRDDDVRGSDHSVTWLSVDEIVAYDWAQTATLSGIVTPATYAAWRRRQEWDGPLNNYPKSYSQGVSGPKVRIVSNEEMDAYVEENKDALENDSTFFTNSHLYTKVEWDVMASVAAGPFYNVVIPQMVRVQRKGGQVRAVFGFDN